MCGRHEGLQVVGVTLRGVVWIVRTLEQRIRGDARAQSAALAVEDRETDALCPEINARHNGQ
jgi:hypothetical protein